MEVIIKTLTPLWTGGVDAGKCDRIHETGILGSLRWWMEVLVRGMGGKVCDPTEQKCLYDPKKPNNNLCDVCQIFGATGWKRRFRLEIQEIQVSDASVQHPMKANRTYTDSKGESKTPTWYFQNPPKSGSFTIHIQSLHPDFKPEVIGGLIQFIADWSALGARPQMGFGVIQVEGSRIDAQPLHDWLINTVGSNTYSDLPSLHLLASAIQGVASVGSNTYSDLPSLQNIFLAKIQPKDSNSSFKEQDTFNLKYDLRNLFRTEESKITEKKNQNQNGRKGLILKKDKKDNNVTESDSSKDLRHFIMGTVEDDRIAAKVKISRSYDENDKLMRVWGWIPEEAGVYTNGWNREKVVDAICQYLTANYTLHDWREMNSDRDTKAKKISDAKIFLHSLLKLQEESDAV
jgi:CRISPR-associated protein Cmr1